MPVDPERVHKPVRKLRKLVKKISRRASPKEVHTLRTNTRRVEASMHALALSSKRNSQRLLRDLKRLRKRAGKTRDMDVLTGFASSVHPPGEEDCAVQLLEHLGAKRRKYAKRLGAEVTDNGSLLRKRLRRAALQFDKRLKQKKISDARAVASELTASAMKLTADLSDPARLGRNNLHPYRLKVKELRNVLQVSKRANGHPFVNSLGEVKDVIGEWHDWQELTSIATDVLDHGSKCQLTKTMKKISDAKYQHALDLTEKMRKNFLQMSNRTKRMSSPRTNSQAAAAQVAAAMAA